jgi:hypothetical protein
LYLPRMEPSVGKSSVMWAILPPPLDHVRMCLEPGTLPYQAVEHTHSHAGLVDFLGVSFLALEFLSAPLFCSEHVSMTLRHVPHFL